jgi:hypothetical protein
MGASGANYSAPHIRLSITQRKRQENMKLRQTFVGFVIFLGVLTTSAHAQTELKYWPVQQKLPSGKVEFKVIEEDPSLRNQLNQISQRVIYDQAMNPNEVPTDIDAFAAEILASRPHAESFLTPHTAQPLWVPVKDAWTQADEDAYSTWFAQQDENFDSGTGLLGDCADMGLLFRWVYARNNLLPIANTMAGSGKLFGHFSGSTAWDQLATNADWKKDERFKAALRYLFDNTYTRTVVSDIFPTFVNNQYVRPGSMFMIIRPDDGHTQTIANIDPTQGITTFWGNEPAAEDIYSSGIIIETQNKMTIGMWRQVRKTSDGSSWELTPSDQMPGYSLEQFQQTFNDDQSYNDWLNQAVGVQVSDENLMYDYAQALGNNADRRLQITIDSIPNCVATSCATNSEAYSNYSTPDLDARLASEQKLIAALIQKIGPQSQTVLNFYDELKSPLIQGTNLTLLSMVQDPSVIASFSSDPHASFEARWGITAGTPTIDFYLNYAALISLSTERDRLVSQAVTLCQNGCDTNSAKFKALETTTLDQGIKMAFQSLTTAQAGTGFDSSALSYAQSDAAGDGLYASFGDASCKNTSTCTQGDILFGTGASTRLAHWTANPQDKPATRWGF